MPLLCGSPPRRSISPSHAPGCEASKSVPEHASDLFFPRSDPQKPCVGWNSLSGSPPGASLADRLLDDTRTRKSISAPGSARMISPRDAKLAVTPPVVGSAGKAYVKKSRLGMTFKGREVFSSASGDHALLHSRAAGSRVDDNRKPFPRSHALPHGQSSLPML